ncbi:MAG: metal-sulfur cluster assembly factor, partial [Planctomycetaceae bacterium]|nr:metal-sulfur cluster assembly factor [Planctomycetaceae bacterium]
MTNETNPPIEPVATPSPDNTRPTAYPDRPVSDEIKLLETLKQVIDPELMVNIVDLGLIYSVVQEENRVEVEMTLTSPACPAGPQIMQQAKMALEKLADIDEANIKLVMAPPWTPDRMTDDARDQLG